MYTNRSKSCLALALMLTTSAPTAQADDGIYSFLMSKEVLGVLAGVATYLGVGFYRGEFSSETGPSSNSVLISQSGNNAIVINGQRFGDTNTLTEDRRQDFTDVSKLDVKDFNGTIKVGTHNEEYVRVDQNIKYSTPEQLGQLDISNTQNGNSLRIRVQYPRPYTITTSSYSWFESWSSTSTVSTSPEVSHTILLPHRQRIDQTLATTSGDIKTSNTQGTMSAHTLSGDLTIDRHTGEIDAQSTSGDIKTSNTQGTMSAHTLSGNLTIDRHTGKINNAQSTSGDIKTSNTQGTMSAHTLSGNLTIDRHTGKINAQNTSGNISIYNYLAGAVAKLKSQSGFVQCPHSFRKEQQGWVGQYAEGTIGDGQYPVHATTNTGNVSFTGLQPE